jgi:cell wall-associated NlpC family hydrolase
MRLGVVVDGHDPEALARAEALGATAISLSLRQQPHLRAFLQQARTRGLAVLGVLDRETFRARLDWRSSAEADLNRVAGLVESGLIDALAIGHEPDDGFKGELHDDPLAAPRGGVGSWVLPLAELSELAVLVRTHLAEGSRRIPLVLGGLCSWHPEILAQTDLALFDGILIHPYGAGSVPEEAIGAYLDSLAHILAERGLTDRVRLGVGELGWSDQVVGRGQIADFFSRVLPALAARADVDCCIVCCEGDRTLDGYGQFDLQDRPKPSVAAIWEAGRHLPQQDPLIRVARDPLVTADAAEGPAEPLVWDDPYFTPEMVAQALSAIDQGTDASGALAALVASLWPEFSPYLAEYHVSLEDPAPRAALLAAIYIATAGRFAPTAEGGSYIRAERRYQGLLGNRYHGDGWRYRGRGLVRIRGRDTYDQYGQRFGLPLVDEPDLALEPAIAAGITATLFAERGLFEAALRGDWVSIWRAINPSLNGYYPFVDAVQSLLDQVDATQSDSRPAQCDTSQAAYEAARSRLGDAYAPGGDGPGAFDALGLVAWSYSQVGVSLPMGLDALFAGTHPISSPAPGDLTFFSFGDPTTGGSSVDHVALATDQDGLVLDARVGVGVSYRPHVRGAVRRYRRWGVPVETDRPGPDREEDDEVWREKYEALQEEARELAASVFTVRHRLGARPGPPAQPTGKAPKRDWTEYGGKIRHYQERVDAIVNDQTVTLGGVEAALRRLAQGGTDATDEPAVETGHAREPDTSAATVE